MQSTFRANPIMIILKLQTLIVQLHKNVGTSWEDLNQIDWDWRLFTKVNGKDVIVGPMLHNLNRFVLQECGKGVEGVWLWRISGIYNLTPFTNFPMMFTSLLYSVMVRSSSPFSYLSNHPFIFLKHNTLTPGLFTHF